MTKNKIRKKQLYLENNINGNLESAMYSDNKHWKEPLKSEDPQTKNFICIILPLMAFNRK